MYLPAFEHIDKFAQHGFERSFFREATSVIPTEFIYTPKIMLLYEGYACQPDAISPDFRVALEIKSLSAKNYSLTRREGELPYRFKKVYHKYFLTNPYLEKLVFFFIDRDSQDNYFIQEFTRPEKYNLPIKRAHTDDSKIKGDYTVIDLGALSYIEAVAMLAQHAECSTS